MKYIIIMLEPLRSDSAESIINKGVIEFYFKLKIKKSSNVTKIGLKKCFET